MRPADTPGVPPAPRPEPGAVEASLFLIGDAGRPDTAGEPSRRILVVGGGVSGMTAALETAKAGYDVTLVEKQAALGGWAGKLWKRIAFREPYEDPAPVAADKLIAAINAEKRIRVHLRSTVAKTSGEPGRFVVDIAEESGALVTQEVGAIIQASGFTPYDAARLWPELGYGGTPNVVDQAGLEQLAREAAARGEPIRRPSDGGEVRTVAFIQCAGQRDETGKHLPYCSGTTRRAASPA